MPPGGEPTLVIAVDDDSPGPPPAPSLGSRGAAPPKDKPYKAMPRSKAKPLPGRALRPPARISHAASAPVLTSPIRTQPQQR
eukprot:7925930-Alexandrium_andersonii.AAC.1